MEYKALKNNGNFWKEGEIIPFEIIIQWFTQVGIRYLINDKQIIEIK